MIRLFAQLSANYLIRHFMQTMLMILGIALGVATFCMSSVIENSLDRALEHSRDPLFGSADIYVSNGDTGVPKQLAGSLKRVPGGKSIKARIIKRGTVPELNGMNVLLLGIDHDEDRDWDLPGVTVKQFSTKNWVWSRTFGKQDVLIGHHLDQSLQSLRHGFRFAVDGRRTIVAAQGTIEASGASSPLAGNVIVMSMEDTHRLLGTSQHVTRLDIVVDSNSSRQSVLDAIRLKTDGLLNVNLAEHQARPTGDVMQTVKTGLSLGGMATLPLGVFLVASMTAVSITSRQKDIGILRTMGATCRQIQMCYFAEATVIGLIASIIGIPIGFGISILAIGPIQQALSEAIIPIEMKAVQLNGGNIVGALLVGIGATLIGAALPIFHGTSLSPIEAIKHRYENKSAEVPWQRQSMVAIILAIGGLISFFYRDALPDRWGSYTCLMLIAVAVVYIAPVVALQILRWLQRRIRQVSWSLALDSILGSPGRARFVMTAVALSVAVVVQLAGTIHSNERGVTRWVDRSIAGDLFVTSGGPLTASGQSRPMSKDLIGEIARILPKADIVPMRFRFVEILRKNHADRVLVLALDSKRYVTANKDRTPLLPDLDSFRELSSRGTMIVSENYAELQNLHLGETQLIPGSTGAIPLRCVGIVPDYSCATGTIMVDESAHPEFADKSADVLDVYLGDDQSLDSCRQQLVDESFTTREDLTILTRTELRRHILSMVRNLYGLAYAQEAVVALIAIVGIAASLIVSTMQRQRELGFLRAQGATRGQIILLVLVEAIVMSFSGAIIGVLLGLSLDWYTLNVILSEETGFPLAFESPFFEILLACCVSVIAALVAGIGPARHAAWQPISIVTATE